MPVSTYAVWWAAPVFLLVAFPALADVYRCQLADGRIAYQDIPCSTGTQKKVDNPASAAPKDAEAAPPAYKLQRADLEHRAQIRDAISSGMPMVSMTRAELNEAMGKPDKENSAQYESNFQDQLIYYRHGRTLYVYIRNGIVTSIQNMQGSPVQPRTPCASEYDIRRLEMDMSHYKNRENPELMASLQKKLSEAKQCR